ncbi:MAG: site-specific integrase, partial [Acidothermus sp.]|nr:site-specific integrase [Acidothermus sp.]
MTVAEAEFPALGKLLENYLAHLAVERGLAKNTIASYRRDLTRYLEFLHSQGKSHLREVTEEDVVAFLAALRRGDARHPPLA